MRILHRLLKLSRMLIGITYKQYVLYLYNTAKKRKIKT